MSADRQETTDERMERLEAKAAWLEELAERIINRLDNVGAPAIVAGHTLRGEGDGQACESVVVGGQDGDGEASDDGR